MQTPLTPSGGIPTSVERESGGELATELDLSDEEAQSELAAQACFASCPDGQHCFRPVAAGLDDLCAAPCFRDDDCTNGRCNCPYGARCSTFASHYPRWACRP